MRRLLACLAFLLLPTFADAQLFRRPVYYYYVEPVYYYYPVTYYCPVYYPIYVYPPERPVQKTCDERIAALEKRVDAMDSRMKRIEDATKEMHEINLRLKELAARKTTPPQRLSNEEWLAKRITRME